MLLDTNIIIYAAGEGQERLQDWLEGQAFSVSVISRIEVLGRPHLGEEEKIWLADFFRKIHVHELTPDVAERAIHLRQQRLMSMADAIMAATALVHRLKLATHNVADFNHIADLEILDPLVR